MGAEPPRPRYQPAEPDSQFSVKSTREHAVGHDDPVHVGAGGHATLSQRPIVQTKPEPQEVPQEPQFEVVLSDASQPLPSMRSQLPKPDAQAAPQVPATHAGAPLVTAAQTVPQVPQLVALVVGSTQVPEHDVRPVAQGGAQVPLTQTRPEAQARPHAPQFVASVVSETQAAPQTVCPAGQLTQLPLVQSCVEVHARPQAPQLVALVLVFTSQPSATVRLQSSKPLAQAPTTQLPLAQACVETLARAQRVPQAPQLLGSKLVSVQLPEHTVSPAPQLTAQVPAVQTCPDAQAAEEPVTLHRPQLALSVLRLVSQPLAATPSQSAKPAAHAPSAQLPAAHVAAALGKRHTTPQPPQFEASAARTLTSQPSLAVPLQSAKPALQPPMAQRPLAHALTLALARAHTVPQPPQFRGSVAVFTQSPEHAVAPAPHVVAQVPLAQTCPAEHAPPQRPQLALSVPVFTSQPLAALLSQSAKPALQAPIAQAPVAHVAAALGKRHTTPQPPQFESVGAANVDLAAVARGAVAVTEARGASADDASTGRAGVDAGVGEGARGPAGAAVHGVGAGAHAVARAVGGARAARGRARAAEHTCPDAHAPPQRPQLALSVPVLVSQPLAGLPSQSAKPALHAPIAQVPDAHVAAALAKRHTTPQPPQFEASAPRTLSSQPSAAVPLQSPKPALHEPTTHRPPTHALTAAFARAQAVPQAPQLAGSVIGETQLRPQVICSAPHDAWQLPAAQTWPAAQAFPHAPQWSASVWRSRQVPSQSVWLITHATTHAPPTQAFPMGHALPHAPQLRRSVRVSAQYLGAPASEPASPAPPQVASIAPHETSQRPIAQTCPAGHVAPQAPQLALSVWGFTQRPAQSDWPSRQRG